MERTTGAEQIIRAAEPLFAVHGYDGVSMQRIAVAAGVSKANIYHHFPSKKALYLAVLRYALEDIQALLTELHQAEGDSREKLAHFARAQLEHLLEHDCLARLVLRELLDGDHARGRELAEQVFAGYFNLVQALLAQGQREGQVRRDVDAGHMAAAIAAMNVFLFQNWPALKHLPGERFADIRDSGRTLFALLFDGLNARGGSHA